MDFQMLYSFIQGTISDKKYIDLKILDSLQYTIPDFINKIIDNVCNNKECNTKIINLFCISTTKEKFKSLKNYIKKYLIENISTNINIDNCSSNLSLLDQFLNQYICHLLKINEAPSIFSVQINDLSFIYLTSSTEYTKEPPLEVKQLFSLWYDRERPILFGKQIMTQSFYFKNLIGRKCLSIIPSYEDNHLYMLLEGNIKVAVDYPTVSPINYLDTTHFNETSVETILYDPAYSFGYVFEPLILFLDWLDVYLYVIALLDVNLEDTKKLKLSYTKFLKFIEENICETNKTAKTIFDDEYYCSILKKRIKSIRKFTTGEEEFNLSQDFIFTVQHRWIYLETILNLLKNVYPNEFKKLSNKKTFEVKHWNVLLKKLASTKSFEKGKAMENLAEYFFNCINGIKIVGKNVRNLTEEIDLCLCNYSNESILWKLGPIILVECKNQKQKIPSKTIRNLSYVMESKGISTTILFTASPLTKPALAEIEKVKKIGKYFIVFNLEDLKSISSNPIEILKNKSA